MKSKLKTKFGTAMINNDGYYVIKTTKEGHHNKLLHRLIWEDFYSIKIPKGYVIHHKNGNKCDNCILNLQLMSNTNHRSLHNLLDNPNKGHSLDSCKKMSMARNPFGYFRVTKQICRKCTNGFVYTYRYFDGNKRKSLSSVNLEELKEKVLAKGLIWEKIGGTIEV